MSQAMQTSPSDLAHGVSESISFSIGRAELLRALSHVQSVVEKRGTIPILSNVRINAHQGELELVATDMEIAVVDKVAANVSAVGSTTVPAHMLYDIVRKLSDGDDIVFAEDRAAQKVNISAGSSRFSLFTLPVDDFPSIAEGELPHSFILTRSECSALIEKTRFAMSTEETRYYLNGVYLHAAGDEGRQTLRAVATDGHRLAQVEVPLPAGAAMMPGVIIPRKTIAELSKLLEESITEVKISLSDTKIRFICGDVVLVSKLIDGTFPDYGRVIPTGNDFTLTVNASDFARAVDRVSVIASDKARGVKVTIAADQLTLQTTSNEQNSGEERIAASFDGEETPIGFNARYLMDVLAQIESEQVVLAVSNANAPAVVTDPADESVLFVVMPMRV